MPAATTSASVAIGAGRLVPVGLGSPLQQGLQGRDGVGLNRRVSSPLDGKAERTVERREIVLPEPPGLPLTETHPGHSDSTFHLVIERYRISPKVQPAGQRLQPFPGRRIHQLTRIEGDPGTEKPVPAVYTLNLLPDPAADLLRGDGLQGSPGAPPELVQIRETTPETVLIGMHRFAIDQGLGQRRPGRRLEFGRNTAVDRLDFGLEIEPEVAAPALDHEPLVFAGSARAQPSGGPSAAYRRTRS